MTPRTEELRREVLALPAEGRAELMASLEVVEEASDEIDAAWATVARRRALDDESDDIPWEEVQADAYAHLRAR